MEQCYDSETYILEKIHTSLSSIHYDNDLIETI